MFLLLNDGKTQREIAEFIGCSLKTVAPWCVHGDPNNLESLEDGRKNGNHKKATEEYSVFQSAEVQKLWVLGNRQEAKVKREEKYVYLTSLGNAIY